MKWAALIAALALGACDFVIDAVTLPSDATDPPPGSREIHALHPRELPAFFDCLRERGAAVVSAHRGGPAPGFAENAIPTMANTTEYVWAFMEVDVSRTSDGVLVLMHDDTVDRTTTGTGAVSALTAAQFSALSLQDESGRVLEAHPPTLREALDWAEFRTVLELDVKRGVSYEDVAADVRTANAMDRVVFITYSVDGAARLARVAPDAMMYVTIERDSDLDELERRGVSLAHVVAWTGIDEPNAELNVALAQRGVEVRFGTLGGTDSWDARFEREGRDQYAAFAETGIHIIATDRTREAMRDLDEHDGLEESYPPLECARVP